MNNGFKTKAIITVLAVGALIAVFANFSQRAHPTASPDVKLLNAELLDQNGAQVRFTSDIVGDRIIALNFIYTDCSTACPVVSAIFEKLQNQLGEKRRQDVRLVSLSINPATDTPERLKAYAAHFHAQSEWSWLTGEKSQVDALLKGLGVYSTDYTDHTPVILVGDPVSGVWTRFNGFTSPETITARIDELLATRNEN
jgi:protein SCO1